MLSCEVREVPPRIFASRVDYAEKYNSHVGTDLYSWCDFCVFTTKGILVERIFLDPMWCTTYVPQLEEYFSYHMLPEIVYPQYKPSHIL